jgi:tetratricopeptide (TPR) repeat protein
MRRRSTLAISPLTTHLTPRRTDVARQGRQASIWNAAELRLCLNMIVRNESAILERCLRSVLPFLSCYLVCDTGSTDNTVELVGQLLADLPGEIHSIPFVDFGTTRNQALQKARDSELEFDYLLLIDADMELLAPNGFPSPLTGPAYLLRQQSGSRSYYNVRLLARHAEAHYVGPTHEYLALGQPATRLAQVRMLDHACGSSRVHKTERDLALLGQALEQNPDDARSMFYLAQTLREAGRYEEALQAYQRRLALGGWEEEVWYSQWMLACCQQALGRPLEFVDGCLRAYQLRPCRAEPLHALATHYRLAGQHELAAMFCETGLAIPRPDDLLFLDEEAYRSGFRHEFSISGYYCRSPERRNTARRYAAELAVQREVPGWVRDNARANWKHYARGLSELCPSARLLLLTEEQSEGFRPCNPSLAVLQGRLWCVLRTVNWRLEGGAYLVEGDGVVRTRNYLLELDDELRPLSSVPIVEDPPRPPHPAVEGLEDIRLFAHQGQLRASCTIVCHEPGHRRRLAVFDLALDGRASGLTAQSYQDQLHQKNWVPFVEQNQPGFIYLTDPTTVLRWDPESRQVEERLRQPCPLALEHQRGSSGAIPFEGGWLYVTHEVIHGQGRRTYLHRFLQLDAEFRLSALSEPFFFTRLGVEFCCGMVERRGELLLSFGVEDRQAWMAVLPVEAVRGMLRPISELG